MTTYSNRLNSEVNFHITHQHLTYLQYLSIIRLIFGCTVDLRHLFVVRLETNESKDMFSLLKLANLVEKDGRKNIYLVLWVNILEPFFCRKF